MTDTEGLVADLESRDSPSDVCAIGPLVMAKSNYTHADYTFRGAASEFGYRVASVIPEASIVLYVPLEWYEGGDP